MDSSPQRRILFLAFLIPLLFIPGGSAWAQGASQLHPQGSPSDALYSLTGEAAQLIWGPTVVTRETGTPETHSFFISASEAPGTFFLRLINGTPEGEHRVSSATVKLNGREIFRPSQFNQRTPELSRQVTVSPGENLLEIKLQSAPGAFISIELYHLETLPCRVFGPRAFVRQKGKPINESLVFEVPSQFSGPFAFNVINGDPRGLHRVDSAVIRLNGQMLWAPSDFNERVEHLSRTVVLRPVNTLDVELRGAPGDQLRIEITGYDVTPPSVTITDPPDGAVFSSGPIVVRGTVDDPLSSLTVNGVPVSVSAEGSFKAEGIVLQEGENTIVAIAMDRCGNQGIDQITVHLRTNPRGPKLILCAEPFREQTPKPPGDRCNPQAPAVWLGLVVGLTDETAVSVTINGVLLPPGTEIFSQGDVSFGKRDGDFFWAFVNIPGEDGIHPFTGKATNASGDQTEATVTFVRDTVPPKLVLTSPPDGFITNLTRLTVTGTVDDPTAEVTLGSYGSEIPVQDGTFAVEVSLSLEGPNDIVIAATDPYYNTSLAFLTVFRDTLPPQITVTSPGEGMATNQPTLVVAGSVMDETIEKVTVVLNSGPLQILNLTGSQFSGNVTLIPGPNALNIEATDKAGNISGVTRSVLLDIDPPSVSILFPLPDAQVSGTLTVAAEANDPMSGVASVTLLIDGQLKATLTQPPFNFSLDTSGLVPGPHTLSVTAQDRAGNQAEASIPIGVSERFKIEVVSPVDGATVNKSKVLLKGIIHGQTGEVGVVVNGVLAEVNGKDFAVIIPLQEGQNIVNVVATTADGVQAETSLAINMEAQQEVLRLTAFPTSGILNPKTNVLDVIFEAEAFLENPVSNYSWDFDGDENPEKVGTEAKTTAQYQAPGLYSPKVTITDTQGRTYTETTLVNVLSSEEMDALLRNKWEGMRAKLSSGDVEGALPFFDVVARQAYRDLFNALLPILPTIVQEMSDIELIEHNGSSAIYDIRTVRDGIEYSFQLLFIQGLDGIWRIDSF